VHNQLWQRSLWKEIKNRQIDGAIYIGDNIFLGFSELGGGLSTKSGPVAQLGARFHGMEEVVGSIPTRSTIFNHSRISLYRCMSLAHAEPAISGLP
jgi:hypothetical protein